MMLFSGFTEIQNKPEAIEFIKKLGYPAYINPFLGVAKILGTIAILVPRFPRIKEWAYAGFTIDLAGATYSFYATGQDPRGYLFMLLIFVFLFGSYIFYHKRLSLSAAK